VIAIVTNQLISILSGPTPLKWADGLKEPMLSRVAAGVKAPPDFFHQAAVAPFAFIHVETTRDPAENAGDVIEEQRWGLYLFAANTTSQSGGEAVLGGNRVDLGSSRGRGVVEIEPFIKGAIASQLGFVARPRPQGAQPTSDAGRELSAIAERTLDIIASNFPTFPFYPPVRLLKGATAAAISFTLPTRYDVVGYSWSKGGTDPTVATFVAAAPGAAIAFPGGSGAGTYTFFAAFDCTVDPYTGLGVTPPVVPNRWSSQQTVRNGLVYEGLAITVAS